MGEAKRRGTPEQRKQMAIDGNAERQRVQHEAETERRIAHETRMAQARVAREQYDRENATRVKAVNDGLEAAGIDATIAPSPRPAFGPNRIAAIAALAGLIGGMGILNASVVKPPEDPWSPPKPTKHRR